MTQLGSAVLRVLILVAAYLLGAIPSGYLLTKYVFAPGEDIRGMGSGGTGATNVTRRVGLKGGLITYAVDFAKGVLACLLMVAVPDTSYWWIGGAGIAAMTGHVYPVFLGFRGGKGVATGVGACVVVAPLAALAAVLVWTIIAYFSRYVSLASIVGAASLAILTYIFHGLLWPEPDFAGRIFLPVAGFLFILLTHRENILRLISGTENRIGTRVDGTGAPNKGALSGGRQ